MFSKTDNINFDKKIEPKYLTDKKSGTNLQNMNIINNTAFRIKSSNQKFSQKVLHNEKIFGYKKYKNK